MGLEKTVKKFDILVLGDMSVGKSALITRFVLNTFDITYSPTFGIDFLSKMIYRPDAVVRVQFWDSAGRKCFESLLPTYIRDSRLVLVVYDVSRRASFEEAMHHVERVRETHGEDVFMLLVGNKCDVSRSERQVSETEGEAKAQELGIAYCETSAQSNIGVSAAFEQVVLAGLHSRTNQTMKQLKEKQAEQERLQQEADQADLILPSLPNHAESQAGCGCNFVWSFVAGLVKSTVYGLEGREDTQQEPQT